MAAQGPQGPWVSLDKLTGSGTHCEACQLVATPFQPLLAAPRAREGGPDELTRPPSPSCVWAAVRAAARARTGPPTGA